MSKPHLPFVAALFLTLSACISTFAETPLTYSGAEIKGRIVDAETGAPIEGAVVVAFWTMYHQTLVNMYAMGSARRRVFNVEETISGREGRYTIPAWGPLYRPIGWQIDGRDDPYLFVFKPGHDAEGLSNLQQQDNSGAPPFNPDNASLRRSIHDGKDIGIYKLGKKPRKQYGIDPRVKPLPIHVQNVRGMVSQLNWIVDVGGPDRSEQERRTIAMKMRHAIFIAEAEREKLGAEGKGFVSWNGTIASFIRRVKTGKVD